MNLIILALGFSYTIFAFISILWQEQLAAQKAFFSAAQIHAAEVSQGFAQSLQLVRSANAYFRASRHVSRKDFQVFTQPLLSHYHGIQGLAWVPRVSEEQRSKYEKKARSEFPGFHFTERHEADILVPAGQRPEYFPIYYVEPCKRNEKALGYDLGSDSAWRHAIRQAEEKKDIVSSPGVRFVPDGAGRSGLLLFDPVYRDMLGKTATLAGFVVGEFHIGDIVENAIRHAKPLGLDFTLYEGPESLYTHLSRVSSKPREKAAGLNYTARLEVGGRYWTMKLSPAPGRFDTAPEPHAWGVLFAGTAITLALAAYLQIAFSRSASLAEKEGVLSRSQEAAHLGNWEWKIRENRLTWSDETHRIFGIPQRDFDATFEAFLKSVHPDDRPLVRHGFDEALVRNAPFSLNHRIILPDGTVRFVHEQGEMESDTSGRPVRLFGIVQDVTEKRKAEERIEFLAYYDALTGLPNRILLHDRIEVALANARRRNDKVALLFLDLDHFKTINDSLGHSIGDLLLKEVSERLKRWIREQDSIARLGGDEFLVLMPDIRHLQDAAVTAERIVKSMAAGFAIQDHAITVTCSIGISVFPEHGADAETLIKHADTAMYHAKESGRNNFEFFTPEMSIRAMQLMALENSLRLALEKKELFMVYQPQFNILSGKMTGCEALIRWNHPDMGLVPPEKFVPVAENSGLIVPIGEWVLKTVCRQMRRWQDEGLALPAIAVNISAIQLRQKGFLNNIKAMLREEGLSPQQLELELTESLLISNADVMLLMLQEMKEMGLKLLIDDFGTGYSSLSYLRRFPVHKLKIDQSFVRDLTLDPDDDAITGAIISMAKALNLKVIAEGVETEQQVSFLRRHDCDEAQGYYFSVPLQAEAFAKKIREDARA